MSHLYQLMTRKENEFCHTIQVFSEKYRIVLILVAFRDPISRIFIRYQHDGDDTLVAGSRDFMYPDAKRCKTILVEGKDFVSLFFDDLETILLNRNTQLDDIEFDNGEFEYHLEEDEYEKNHFDPIRMRIYQKLASILRYREQKLQVKKLKLKITDENEITSILPYIDPSTMIWFCLKFKTSDPTMSLAEMWALDFWRLAKPKRVVILVDSFYPAMIAALKEAFFNYSYIDYVEIGSSAFMSIEILVLLDEEQPIPDSDQEILRMSWGFYDLSFTRVKCPKVDDVPGEDEDFSSGAWQIEEDLQNLSIEPNERHENEEDLKAKNVINARKVFETDLILKNIVDYVDFHGIQRLRKVSRNIRKCMDRIKPDPEIKTCCFEIVAFIAVDVFISGYYWSIKYIKREDGCLINNSSIGGRPFSYIPEDFRTRCLKDFEINIKHLTSGLDVLRFQSSDSYKTWQKDVDEESLKLSTTPFLESFEEIFRSRTPLKVKQLEMDLIRKTTTVLQQNEVMKVLPFLDSKVLETIELSVRNDKGVENLMELDEISKLCQWMNAKQLIMKNCVILTPIQEMNITHFAKGDITVQTISLEDLRYLKEGFQNSTTLEKFKIVFKGCTFWEFRSDDIYQFMGIPHIQANPFLRNQKNIWFYRMRNCDNILHFVHFVGQCITFAGVEPSKVPENAWIHD